MAYADPTLPDELRSLQETAERFARERIAPRYMQREKEARVDKALIRELGELGLIAPELPEACGGLGLPSLASGLIAEAIGYADINVSYLQVLGSLNGKILAEHAAPDLAEEWIGRIVSGRSVVCIGLTEPRGGSDAANLALSARRDGDRYILKGEKSSISMADQADACVLFARTGRPEDGAHGVSAFLVPMDTPGVSTQRYSDLGSHAIGRSSIFFDDAAIPFGNRLSSEGGGFVQVMQGFDFSRALIGLQVIASAQASLDETWAYVRERQAFGAPIARNQGVTFPLAEAETMLSAIRQLCYHTLAPEGRRPAAHLGGRHVQVARTEDGGRRHPPVPDHARPLWLVARPAAPATAARRDGARDRRWYRPNHEDDHCP